MATFNRGLVKLQHQVWKNKLLTFLNGGELQIAINHKECAIGQWLYTEGGFEKYSFLPEMQQFEKQHAQYHDAIKDIIDLQLAGKSTEAWEMYESIKSFSNELMNTIDALDDKIAADLDNFDRAQVA